MEIAICCWRGAVGAGVELEGGEEEEVVEVMMLLPEMVEFGFGLAPVMPKSSSMEECCYQRRGQRVRRNGEHASLIVHM